MRYRQVCIEGLSYVVPTEELQTQEIEKNELSGLYQKIRYETRVVAVCYRHSIEAILAQTPSTFRCCNQCGKRCPPKYQFGYAENSVFGKHLCLQGLFGAFGCRFCAWKFGFTAFMSKF